MSMFEAAEIGRKTKKSEFKTRAPELHTRLLEGPFPDYTAVLPKGNDKLVTVEREALTFTPAEALEAARDDYDFFFLHVKGTDKAGEDGDFDRKVATIEQVDSALPGIMDAGPDVLLVTGDHSTPAVMRAHSWHPVPFLVAGGMGRGEPEAPSFSETACRSGSIGLIRGCELMPLLAARAGRLTKFGA